MQARAGATQVPRAAVLDGSAGPKQRKQQQQQLLLLLRAARAHLRASRRAVRLLREAAVLGAIVQLRLCRLRKCFLPGMRNTRVCSHPTPHNPHTTRFPAGGMQLTLHVFVWCIWLTVCAVLCVRTCRLCNQQFPHRQLRRERGRRQVHQLLPEPPRCKSVRCDKEESEKEKEREKKRCEVHKEAKPRKETSTPPARAQTALPDQSNFHVVTSHGSTRATKARQRKRVQIIFHSFWLPFCEAQSTKGRLLSFIFTNKSDISSLFLSTFISPSLSLPYDAISAAIEAVQTSTHTALPRPTV